MMVMNTKRIESEGDIYYLFAYKLRKELKRQCDASVFVKNDDDTLVIKISKGPFTYKREIPQIALKLFQGLTVEAVVRETMELYKQQIMGWFFYRWRVHTNG